MVKEILKDEYATYYQNSDDTFYKNGTLYLYHDRLLFVFNQKNINSIVVMLKDITEISKATEVSGVLEIFPLRINIKTINNNNFYFEMSHRTTWYNEINKQIQKNKQEISRYNTNKNQQYSDSTSQNIVDYGGYYKYAKQYYQQGKYQNALDYIGYALRNDPGNEQFLLFKKMIKEQMSSYSASQNTEDYGGYYKYSKQYYEQGKYQNALDYINQALKYDPRNEEYLTLKEMIEEQMFPHRSSNQNIKKTKQKPKQEQKQEPKQEVKKKIKVELATCDKNTLLTLECFDENKANKFIKARDNGEMWYDIDSFADYFNLQPHERVLIEEYLIFPAKPIAKARYGRNIDF